MLQEHQRVEVEHFEGSALFDPHNIEMYIYIYKYIYIYIVTRRNVFGACSDWDSLLKMIARGLSGKKA